MKPVQPALAPEKGRAPIAIPASSCFLVSRETVNLNNLIAGAVKHAGSDCGSIMLRMDELPEVAAYALQLQEAFHLLLRSMLAHQPASNKVYCYVKGRVAGPSLLDEESSAGNYCIEINTNVREGGHGPAQQLLQQAARLFAQNKIGLRHKSIPAGGMLFSLTLYGCAQPQEYEPR